MKYLIHTIAIFGLLLSLSFTTSLDSLKPGTYATFHTSKGDIVCQLYPEIAPKTVANFINLATARQPWRDPQTGETITSRSIYEHSIFHRVIPGFMIQGGDPTGTGRGGPGYRFEDEFSPLLTHDRAGRLCMANSGPNTNGSQFFITLAPTPWLDNHHTIFGQVVIGQEIVEAIGAVKRNAQDKPLTDVLLNSIEVFSK